MVVLPRSRDTYFRDRVAANIAKERLVALVEAEIDPVEADLVERRSSSSSVPDQDDSSSSIVQQIRKRIRLGKEKEVSIAPAPLMLLTPLSPDGRGP